MYKAIL